jgi:pimeloyl-ACP methyl ester carboxylesterase
MSPWAWVLLALVLLSPLIYLLGVTGGVWLNMRLARLLDRRSPERDAFQERVFNAGEHATLAERAVGVTREGVWQAYAFLAQARHFWRPYRFPDPDPEGGPVVVLVAGYLENGGTMWRLGRELQSQGLQPVLLDLPTTLRAVESNVAFVSDWIRQLKRSLGRERIGYVGHSMGGVIGRAYVLSHEDHGLGVVVTLASPHRGTHLAHLGIGASARDLRPQSDLCLRIPPHPRGRDVPVHTLISAHDNIVSPPWSAVLGEGQGEDLLWHEPLGHTGILYRPEIAAQVATWIRAGVAEPLQPRVASSR